MSNKNDFELECMICGEMMTIQELDDGTIIAETTCPGCQTVYEVDDRGHMSEAEFAEFQKRREEEEDDELTIELWNQFCDEMNQESAKQQSAQSEIDAAVEEGKKCTKH